MTTFLVKNDVSEAREKDSGEAVSLHGKNARAGLFPSPQAGSPVIEARAAGWQTRAKAYLFAVLFTVAALLVRLAIGVGSSEPDGLELLFIPIILSAYIGGLGPGLLATLLSALAADYFLMAPIKALSLSIDLASAEWLTMVIGGLLVSGLAESFHRSRRRLQSTLARREQAESELHWKSAFLEAQLDSSNDGILVVDGRGKKLYQNAQMSVLWQIPREIADDPDDRKQIEFVRHRVKNSEAFVARVAHLYAHPDETSHDEVDLIDGTVLDRYSHPVVGRDGTRYGRIWSFRDITARRQAEAATRESEERFRLIAETIDEVFWMADVEINRMLYVSPAYENVWGRSRKELIQNPRSFLEAVHPDDLPGVLATLNTRKDGKPFEHEYRIIRPDKTIRWVRDRGFPLQGAEGRVSHYTGIAQDITRQKEAEAAIQARLRMEERLSRIAASVPGVIYELRMRPDGSFCFPYAGPAVESLFGVPPAQVIEDAGPIFNLVHREDLPRVIASNVASARTLALRTHEFRVRHPSRGEIWIEAAATPEREPDGGTLWHGFLHDVTERKLAQESHARLATAVEQAAEAIVITDPSGSIVYTNPAFETVSGYPREEVLGRNPRMLKSGKHNSEFYRLMWETLGQGRVWSGRITNRRKNGVFYEEDMTISAVRDSAGKVVNYVAVKRDVSREATLEAQLRQAQKMEAIGQLAGGVAHDFNNILTVIQGNAGLLRDTGLPATDRAECTNEIVLAAERAAGLTRQLLLFSRKQVIQPVNLNLNQVIGGTIKMLQRILGEDIVLHSEFAPTLPPVFADAGMIEQVLLNLAVNSRDAMPGGGRLVIATTAKTLDENQARQNAEAAPGRHVCLSVGDTGSGIPPEILPRIFEPFFTTKEVGKGTGLGLATVHGIVKQHHGWIEVESKPGCGTTFHLWFPALEIRRASGNVATASNEFPRGHETILIAEDDGALRQLVAGLLKRCGYNVLQAASGPAALKVWQENNKQVELLLTDVIMPDGMNGFNLAEKLLAERPGLRVLYTSGYTAQAGAGVNCVEGVNLLQKPYSPGKLAELVRKTLDRK